MMQNTTAALASVTDCVMEADSKEELVSQPMTLPETQEAATRERAEGLLDLRAGSD